MRWSRRQVLGPMIAAVGVAAGGPVSRLARAAAPQLGDDGLYTQDWFLESFLELADDLGEAADAGKRFVVMWEQRGCIYCEKTHLINLAEPEISTYIREHFNLLQLNIHGSRIVTDFDGEELEERKMARKYGIRFTPTLQFFAETPAEVEAALAADEPAEIGRVPGYMEPPVFLAMFRYVAEGAYRTETFEAFFEREAG